MSRDRIEFTFLNLGHFIDHYVVLIFATVAALSLAGEWGMDYGTLIAYAMPSFVAFGVFALPAGWLADRWSREGMMAVFFIGIGLATIACTFVQTPMQLATGLFAIGAFAAIYHPVGLAMVVRDGVNTGWRLGFNGICGNFGVASAALLTGYLIDAIGWRLAFLVPGVLTVAVGLAYFVFLRAHPAPVVAADPGRATPRPAVSLERSDLLRAVAIILITTALGGLIFQSTTFALPKVFDERLTGIAESASLVGTYAFLVFAAAAFTQLAIGLMLDRFSARMLFVCLAAAQAVLFFILRDLEGVAALFVSTGLMLAVFGQIPINDILIGRLTTSAWRSRLYALRYLITFSVMASALPLVGWIHERWGFSLLFLILAGVGLLILVSVSLLPATRPNQPTLQAAE